MPRIRRNGFGRTSFVLSLTGLILAAFLICLAGRAAPAAAQTAVAEHTVKADPDAVVENWSTKDLTSAEPAQMPVPPKAAFDIPKMPDAGISASNGPFRPADVNALPARLHGKVFFDLGPDRYQCSGTLVDSRRGNVVYTAGHCVWDTDTRVWVSNLVFIPGYENGLSQFPAYAATQLSAPKGYTENANVSYDIGMVTLDGNPEADLGGARQIAFDLNVFQRKYTIFGYPALPDPPYDGETLAGCRSRVVLRDNGTPEPMGVTPCDMEQGASGGGWITGGNYLNSITSYTYCDTDPSLCGFLWGPYFSKAARALYTSPAGGGSITPTLEVRYAPPKLVRKRKVVFKFGGTGSTPVKFQCRLDQHRFGRCAARQPIGHLGAGRHVLRVRAVDQTGRKSAKTITRAFRVKL